MQVVMVFDIDEEDCQAIGQYFRKDKKISKELVASFIEEAVNEALDMIREETEKESDTR
ncbi:hypothetical protein ACFLU6_06680 [Acidobacteriota bacterium]